ncbi:zinc-binding metallopeptidase family protein [Euzebya tangerina]|uniref:zinc-binding metallopeptidase family protein n=1 Tax=Euzebya tangerina TaxID=591198 RepID=UPI000E30CDC6|nr:putative zinc-binding metallopeptidase [Euzebya tangerina]
MRSFSCPNCAQLVYVDNDLCLRCGTGLAFDPASMTMVGVEAGDVRCRHHTRIGCNWLVRDGSALCLSCRLTTVHPPDGDAEGQAAWAEAEKDKRRLVVQMNDLGLDISGVSFEMKSSAHEAVTIGHAEGVITLDVLETDDVRRVRMRERMGEPYRTMLGHFRHEIGHYLWMTMVSGTEHITSCRRVFGDERQDYQAALDEHYGSPHPANWSQQYVSIYATAHPWEDFAETMAHYFHIRGALQTADAFGLHVDEATHRGHPDRSAANDADQGSIDALIARWLPFTYAMNAVNVSMGQAPLYPFVLSPKVVDKLDWIHRLVTGPDTPE